jgi:hypothetical protein
MDPIDRRSIDLLPRVVSHAHTAYTHSRPLALSLTHTYTHSHFQVKSFDLDIQGWAVSPTSTFTTNFARALLRRALITTITAALSFHPTPPPRTHTLHACAYPRCRRRRVRFMT